MSDRTRSNLRRRIASPPAIDAQLDRLNPADVLVRSKRSVMQPISALGFWSAIALPALYLPLLVTGLDSVDDLLVFLGLFAIHLVSLYVGRTHRRD
ncbi:MAG: hypothetical protein SVG88_09570 [Halobacteriales archaeon]|nr:hypothetical protein [Halobacteriales archaeon]